MDAFWIVLGLFTIISVVLILINEKGLSVLFVLCLCFLAVLFIKVGLHTATENAKGKPIIILENLKTYEYAGVVYKSDYSIVIRLKRMCWGDFKFEFEKKPRFYKIEAWKLRNASMAQLKIRDIPTKFKVFHKTTLLPERLPKDLTLCDVYILSPVIDEK